MRIPLSIWLFIILNLYVLHSRLAVGEEVEIQEGEGAAEEVENYESADDNVVMYFYNGEYFPKSQGILEYEAPKGDWDGISPGNSYYTI